MSHPLSHDALSREGLGKQDNGARRKAEFSDFLRVRDDEDPAVELEDERPNDK